LIKINVKYIFTFLVLLITEIIIALYVKDSIIRPFLGDILVVILMYTFIRGIISKHIKLLPLILFIIALAVELAQYYRVIYLLHLENSRVLSTIIGTSFDTKDILCYLIGAVLLFAWEKVEKKRGSKI